jgi:hypothetical protein
MQLVTKAIPVQIKPEWTVELQSPGIVLPAGIQNGTAFLYAVVDPDSEIKHTKRFFLVKDGDPLPGEISHGNNEVQYMTMPFYIGTFLMYDGLVAYHLFSDQG